MQFELCGHICSKASSLNSYIRYCNNFEFIQPRHPNGDTDLNYDGIEDAFGYGSDYGNAI